MKFNKNHLQDALMDINSNNMEYFEIVIKHNKIFRKMNSHRSLSLKNWRNVLRNSLLILEYYLDHNKTWHKLAELAGVSDATLYNYSRGDLFMTNKSLYELGKKLNIEFYSVDGKDNQKLTTINLNANTIKNKIDADIFENKNGNNRFIKDARWDSDRVVVDIDTDFQKRASLSVHFYDPTMIDAMSKYTSNLISNNVYYQNIFFKALDKYLFNFLEEMSEFSHAYRQLKYSNKNNIDTKYPTLRPVVASSSILHITNHIFNKDGLFDEICDLVIYADIIMYIISQFTQQEVPQMQVLISSDFNFDSELLRINEELIKIRRNFTVRKWHKEHTPVVDLSESVFRDACNFYQTTVNIVINFAVFIIMEYNKHDLYSSSDKIIQSINELLSIVELKRSTIKTSILNKLK